jgi:hypothetical protein
MAAACITAAAGAAYAAGAHTTWTTIPQSQLASMRGGFAMPGGLVVSFGIARVVAVNGVVISHTQFTIPDMSSVTPAQAAQLAQHTGTLVVTNGAGNTAGGNTSSGGPAQVTTLPNTALPATLAPGVIVQNTLSNTQVQTNTVIDTVTNSMGLLQGLNFGRSLTDALTRSVTQ